MINFEISNQRFKDINPIDCGFEECSKGHSYGPAVREYYLIHYVINGKGIFVRGGKENMIEKGQIFLIRPFEITFYKADDKTPWTYQWIGFDGLACADFLGSEQAVYDAKECAKLFEDMFLVKDEINKEIFITAKIYELLFILGKKYSIKKNIKDGYVKRAIDMFESKYMHDISIDGVASSLNIDRRYLCRLFTNEVGMSPQKYLVNLRIKKAVALLSERGLTVDEAAKSVGYRDQFNFSKMFKKVMGVSPSFYKG